METRVTKQTRTSRQRTFSYKRAELVGTGGNLAGYITQALDGSLPLQRRQSLGDGPNSTARFINAFKPVAPNPIQIGSLFEFTPGSLPSGFTFDEEAAELPVEALAQLEKGRHFIEGALYFGVLGNHVVIMPSGSLTAKQLEEHFNWLLRDHAQVLSEGDARVVLQDEPTQSLRDRFDGVRSVSVDSPLSIAALAGPEDMPKIDYSLSMRDFMARALVPYLKAAVGELNSTQAESLERMRVRLQIGFDGRTERVDTSLLDHLVALLPDDESTHYSFDVRGVGKVRAGELKVVSSKSVIYENGLPVFGDVAEKMHSWLFHLLESNRVRP